ncbi:unnamed protein product, partial [Ectocarpus fasciculatus]
MLRRFGAPTMEKSPSSFASTSFESGASETSRRRRRSDQARVLASWRNSTGSTGFSGSRSRQTVSRVLSSGTAGGESGSGGGVTPTNHAPAPVGNRVREKLFRRKSSEAHGGGVSFLSLQSGSSAASGGIGKGGPAELRRLGSEHSRSYSSGQIDLKMLPPGFGDFPAAMEGPDGQQPIVGDSSTLGTNWVGQNARGGWPLDLPASSAMPRWWIEHASRSGGDSSHGLGGGGGGSGGSDFAAGAPPDLVLAAQERAKA